MTNKEKTRCTWCLKDETYMSYHDNVWGIPEHDSKELLIKLILDGQQAGLSWYTILIKQDNYRRAFSDWNLETIADYNDQDISNLMQDSGIIRNHLKIKSVIKNVRAYLKMLDEGIDFSKYLWDFVDGKTVVNRYDTIAEYPTYSEASTKMNKSLKKAGFSFVGPTICYAFMEAVGMYDNHMKQCWRAKS